MQNSITIKSRTYKLDTIQLTLPSYSKHYDNQDIAKEQKSINFYPYRKKKQKYLQFRDNKKDTSKLAYHLSKTNPNSKLNKQYKRTMNCCSYIEVRDENGRLYKATNSCGCKQCKNCQRKKSSKLAAKYQDDLKDCDTFLTLTRQLIHQDNLKAYEVNFSKFWSNLNKKIKRRTELNCKYLRASEILLKSDDRLHYHFHLVVSDRQTAEFILKQWYEFNMKLGTEFKDLIAIDNQAQDIRDFTGNTKEILKYFTKLDDITDYKRLDRLLNDRYRKRSIVACGFVKAKNYKDNEVDDDDDIEKIDTIETVDLKIGRYIWSRLIKDYINIDTGEIGTEIIKEQQRNIIKQNKLKLVEMIN